MASSDLHQLEFIFHSALALSGEKRIDYLTGACAGNAVLHREVEDLIAAYETGNGLLDDSAVTLAMHVLSADAANDMSGKEVGPYKILKALGRGGMGEVFLGEDPRLGRKVALKFLSGEFVKDNWAKRQLIREAQAVAMLDHPNICQVYGLEEIGEYSFIVMQYVEGETLADLIRAKPLPTDQIITLASQIISALAEAHAHGIIHRDVKPKNIMVTQFGQVKVLDFGLAKIQSQGMEPASDSISHLSKAGLLVGTVAYMSPEQLRGEKLDFRSDIFSLGTVLYEMAAGKNPYARETNVEVISAILTSKPTSLKEGGLLVPRELDRVLQKCCEKDRNQRFQSASELLIEWESYARTAGDGREALWRPSGRLAAAVAALLLLIAISIFLVKSVGTTRTAAILPIANETGDASLDYLGDGLTESIINRLSGLSKLRVKPLTVVAGYRGKGVDPRRIGNDLRVDSVLVGRITGTKDSPYLQTTLISVSDGAQLWTEEQAIDSASLVAIEQEVSQRVISALEPWSRGDRSRIQRSQRPANSEARKEYMLGRYYWRNRDNNHTLKDAIDHFNNAIRLDPNYAEAHAGLADCYALGNVVSYPDLGLTASEAMQRAERAAKDALELDENLAEAHTSLGFVNLRFHWNWQEAEKEFHEAIELKPDYALSYYGYSNLRVIIGPESEAITWSRKAKELDPFSPITALNFCRVYYYARRDNEASKCYDKLLEDFPDYVNGQYGRGLMYLKDGQNQQAIAVLEHLYANDKRAAAAALGYAYGTTGNKEAAHRVLAEMEKLSAQSYIPAYEFALVYLGLRDYATTLVLLDKAANEHFGPTAYMTADPIYDPIRSDPRFIELARKLNLPLQPPG